MSLLSDGDLFWITNGTFDFGGSSGSSSGGGPKPDMGCGMICLCVVGFVIVMTVILTSDLVNSCSSNHYKDSVEPDSIVPYAEFVPDTLLDTISAEPTQPEKTPVKQTTKPGKSTSSKSNIYYYEVEGDDDEYDEEEDEEDEDEDEDDRQEDDDYDEDYDDVDAEDYD